MFNGSGRFARKRLANGGSSCSESHSLLSNRHTVLKIRPGNDADGRLDQLSLGLLHFVHPLVA